MLIGGGAGVGLVVAFALWPRHIASSDLAAAARASRAFGNFLKIGRDGRVTVAVPQVETGQGIWTALPQIVADELGADWESVAVEPAPLTGPTRTRSPERRAGSPASGRFASGAWTTTARCGSLLARPRCARSSSRCAKRRRSPARCWSARPPTAGTSVRTSATPPTASSSHGARTFELRRARGGSRRPLAADARTLRQSQRGRLIGQPLQRLDGPAKIDGSWRFAGDVRLPGMLFASARIGARRAAASPASRRTHVRAMPGVRHVAARDSWVAVVADNWWAAEQTMKTADPKFTGVGSGPDLRPHFERALAEGRRRDGLQPRRLSTGSTAARGRLPRPIGPHRRSILGLEPLTATARTTAAASKSGRQPRRPDSPALARRLPMQVLFYPMPVGEPAGRALEPRCDPASPSSWRATLDRPSRCSCRRAPSQNHDRGQRRCACPNDRTSRRRRAHSRMGDARRHRRRSRLRDLPACRRGCREAREHRHGRGRPALRDPQRSDRRRACRSAGLARLYARLAAARVCLLHRELHRRAGPRRRTWSRSPSECRCSAAIRDSPAACRRAAQLGANGTAAARQHDGDRRLLARSGRTSALVAIASIGERPADSRRTGWSPRSIAARVVNPELVTQQIEGGLIWALAQATVAAPEWVAGMPRARPIGGIGLPRIGDVPEMIGRNPSKRRARPAGSSGLGTTVLAPAVANADLRRHAESGCAACPSIRWRPHEPARRPSRTARREGRRAADQSRHARCARGGAVRRYLAEFLSDRA